MQITQEALNSQKSLFRIQLTFNNRSIIFVSKLMLFLLIKGFEVYVFGNEELGMLSKGLKMTTIFLFISPSLQWEYLRIHWVF